MNTFSFVARDISGAERPLKEFEGDVLLIVNVASHCGFTPQYEGLEKLYQKYKDRRFVVIGFPCNQFGSQESGSNEEIQNFCSTQFNISFPLFAKVDVNGPQAHPLFTYLKTEQKGLLGSEAIKWNFTKFLIDRQGQVQKRFAPVTKPEEIEASIESML